MVQRIRNATSGKQPLIDGLARPVSGLAERRVIGPAEQNGAIGEALSPDRAIRANQATVHLLGAPVDAPIITCRAAGVGASAHASGVLLFASRGRHSFRWRVEECANTYERDCKENVAYHTRISGEAELAILSFATVIRKQTSSRRRTHQ
jgi:hypothetical protein